MGLLDSADSKDVALNGEKAFLSSGPGWVPACINISYKAPAYRPRDELEAWPLGDPVIRLKTHLIASGAWSEERHKQAEAEVLDDVITAQKAAESHGTLNSGGKPAVGDMFEDVYAEMPLHLRRQRRQAGY